MSYIWILWISLWIWFFLKYFCFIYSNLNHNSYNNKFSNEKYLFIQKIVWLIFLIKISNFSCNYRFEKKIPVIWIKHKNIYLIKFYAINLTNISYTLYLFNNFFINYFLFIGICIERQVNMNISFEFIFTNCLKNTVCVYLSIISIILLEKRSNKWSFS